MEFIAGGIGIGSFLKHYRLAGKKIPARPAIALLVLHPLGEQAAKEGGKAGIRLSSPDPGAESHLVRECERYVSHDASFV